MFCAEQRMAVQPGFHSPVSADEVEWFEERGVWNADVGCRMKLSKSGHRLLVLPPCSFKRMYTEEWKQKECW